MNATFTNDVRFRPEASVHGLFLEQVAAAPERIALVWTGGSMTYGTLAARANALAARLVELGVGRDVPVALCLDRSPEAIVGVLATLIAGGAYLPLDPTYPVDRLAFALGDAAAKVVLTNSRLLDRFAGRSTIALDRWTTESASPPPVESRATDLAYVMYTSGSTGTPKGVQIEHRSIVRLVGRADYVRLGADTRMLHAAPLGFDASTLELWGPLLHGGRCVLYPDPVPTGRGLRAIIRAHGVTTAWLTAALFNAVVDDDPRHLAGLSQLLTGGEALSPSHVRRALAALPETELINGYGPTECTTFTTTYSIPRDVAPDATSIPIGTPIPDTELYVLDAERRPVAPGDIGELYVGGRGVARGYLRRPELDAEKFVVVDGVRLYRTGDLVRVRDGVVDFVGRVDHQVKIRGFRIELGEIEASLARLPGIAQAAVLARDDGSGKRLVAYLVGKEAPAHALREALATTLPEFMIPSAFVWLPALPITANGKLDRAALPAPENKRPELAQPYRTPEGEHETTIARVFGELLGVDRVGALDGFFELGGNSLLALKALARLSAAGLPEISHVTFFENPTPKGLAAALSGTRSLVARKRSRSTDDEPIAIIGMAGRFPGAKDVDTFFQNLCEGRESIRFFGDAELDPSIPASVRNDPAYVRARGVLDDVEGFDAGFFGITPLEAQLMDPQHRHFLEVCWEALEHASTVPDHFHGTIGVFGGMFNATYFQRHVRGRPDLVERLGELNVMLANEKDYVTSRVAHRLGLSGPAVSIHTACSTSLVATAAAMDSLRAGQCDIALAGGVAITSPPNSGHLYQEGSMASADGHTRPFDHRAAGTVFSDGVAVVVLARLRDALAMGAPIHAVLRGAAVNNDGAGRASFTAPSAEGQATVIAAAYEAAGVDPRTVSYVETHGTATPLGDPIEIEGLTRAFRAHTSDTGFCAIGSLKANVGHMVIAAGASSLIKVARSLSARVLPPSINFEKPTPKIDFEKTPFVVNTQLRPWTGEAPLRAGVSSFGFGGTNAHVVVEEAPARAPSGATTRPGQLIVLSARSAKALDEASKRLDAFLDQHPEVNLADVAHTTRVGRRAFTHRRWLVAADVAGARKLLASPTPTRAGSRAVGADLPDLAFLAPGQGSQYANMGHGLYDAEPVFRAAWDECCAILGDEFRAQVFSGDAARLAQTSLTQPAIFTLEYSLARLFLSWGLRPTALIGHSVGEFACAVLAEVMSLSDAAHLVALRGRLMQALPAGSMLSVRLPAKELGPRLRDGVCIAAENGPSLCVAAGPSDAIDALSAQLDAEGVVNKRLVTSHAFHSSMMDPVVEPFAAEVAKVRLSPPKIPIVSTVTADYLTAEDATSVRYWAEHLRKPVRFAPAVAKLLESPRRVLLEIGPRATLSALARQAVEGKRALPVAIPSLGDAPEQESDSASAALGQLWSLGASVDFDAYAAHETRHRVALPTYPFEHQRHWIEAERVDPIRPTAEVQEQEPPMPAPVVPTRESRDRLVARVCELVEEVSGADVSGADPSTPWLDLGLDSLTLTQLALQIGRSVGVKVTFRQIMEQYPTIGALASMLEAHVAPEPAPAPAPAPAPVAQPIAIQAPRVEGSGTLQDVINAQLQLMAQQLALLGGAKVAQPTLPAPQAQPAPVVVATKPAPKNEDDAPAGPVTYDVKKAFGAIARIHTKADELSPHQRARLDAFMKRYSERTRKSKEYTQQHRAVMADPRVVNGFRPLTKEITYQIVIERSRGSRLWDIDGNEYIDVLNGFGMNMFGWQPDFLRKAVHEQVDLGYEIGPQHVLAGEVAELFAELTGADRVAFCNTGSEAVMGTMRIARTVTGRSLVAIFTGAYHGIFDEVIVRGTKKLKTIPAAPGIMPSSSQNMLVLDYGTPESLEILKQRAHELAAVVVEPVQSRRPDFQPIEFLREVRALTEQSGTVLVFDEVVTGFRSHPGGAQALFGIRADLASYGKVVGAGMPIGVIAGKRQFMDALDGGFWQYGDDSIPSVGPTYFAGTFVRHPLALATAKAALLHMKEMGPALQAELTGKVTRMAAELNAWFSEVGAPMKLNHFASLWRNAFTEDLPYNDLVYAMIRDRGIHILDNFPCFLTESHSDEDVAAIVRAYKEAVTEMQAGGFFPAAKRRTIAIEAPRASSERVLRRAPSTEPQREIWLATRLGTEASLAFNESVSLQLRGELDVGALRAAVRELVNRHDALRSTFSADGLEMIVPADPPELEVPLRDADAAELAATRERHVTEAFDLELGPLVRAEILRLSPDHHVLVFTGHHIVLDGWSYWVIVKELAALYAQQTGARGAPLPVAPSFAEYALAQEKRKASPELAQNERWWVERFADGAPTLDLPTDRPRPALRTQVSGRVDRVLPADVVAAVRKAGAKHGTSLFATLLAGFDVLLHRLSGQTDLVVGIPAAGQNSEGNEGLVGHCVGMLPLRARLTRETTFAELLGQSKQTVLDAFEHQDVTFGRVLQQLPLARDPARLPLISVVFNIDQAMTGEGHAFPGLEMIFDSNPRRFETFELFVNAVDLGAQGMRLECQYNRDLFDHATVERWLASFETLLRGAAIDTSAAVGKLPILSSLDRALLDAWNRTDAAYPQGARIEGLVAATIRRVPDKVAIQTSTSSLTYGELGRRARELAGRLRAHGVGAGDLVGLMVDRDEHLLVGLLGILEAGAGYLPLDPSFPEERLAFMRADAKVKLVVDRAFLVADGPTAPPSGRLPSTEDVAYVIYTSGSTGKPKGVRVPHRSAVNLLASVAREPGMRESDVVLAVTTLSFDIAVSELVLPLTVGATIVLANKSEATDGDRLRSLIEERSITFVDATPSTWRMLLAAGWKGGAITAICTGEAMPRDLATELLPRVSALWNGYGPTETTVWSSFHRVDGKHEGPVPIGKPIANTQIHVLDENLAEVPVGVVGELWIGGDGVTLGYLDRPELTSERFVADPFRIGGRMYRTGDLGRWRNQGFLECLGRTDFQVKIRGYRIELGEIETALSPVVGQAVVMAREDRPGDVRLVAYVVPRGEFDEDAVRAYLGRVLPDYMVPSRFVKLAALPLLPNGKVDRKSLPAPTHDTPAEAFGERTKTEALVADVFCEMLALPRVGLTDDFFRLGGHSLLAAQMAARLGQRLERSIPMRVIFERPTVRGLAAWLDQQKRHELPRVPRRDDTAPAPLSFMQQRIWYLEQLELGKVVYNVPSAHRLHGPMDQAAFQRAFDEMVRRQSTLRTIIGMREGSPVQVVLDRLEHPLFPAEDLSSLPHEDRERELARRLTAHIGEPFDLGKAPLFQARMYKLGPEEHLFFFMPHHVVWDGWSFDLFYEEMSDLYGAYSRGRTPKRPAPSVTYQDFTDWHRGWLAGEELQKQIAFWREKLDGAPDALDIPLDRPRPPVQSGEGSTEWLKLSPEATKAMREVGLREGATLFMSLLAAWALLLHRLTGQRELVIGTPVRGRNLPELENVMGFFVNALPLRLCVDPDQSFVELLRTIRKDVMEAFDHQDVPFEHLVRVLDLPRDESRFPLYQSFFSYQDARNRPLSWGELQHEHLLVFQPASAQDLSLWFLEGANGPAGGLNYNTDILDLETVQRIKARYLALVDEIARDPQRTCGDLLSISAGERAQIERWNETRRAPPAERDLARYLGSAIERFPRRIAVRSGDRALTYAELWTRAGCIGAALRERGVRPGDVVALHLERSTDMLAALLGVLRAGATYLPLDPEFPRDRVRFMLDDSKARIVVTDGDSLGMPALHLHEISDDAEVDPGPMTGEEPAYLIYTSGSTGKPKGVLVPHRAVINFLQSMQREPGLRESDRLVAVTTLSFDIAVLELLLPLTVGAEVVLATRQQATDGVALKALLESSNATIMQATPATWRMLVEAGFQGGAAFTALCGGEALPPELADALLARSSAVWNMYGPTETTVWSTCGRVLPGDPIHIGKPIANTQIWILDERGALAPIGVPGEIYIGGDGVALGYHARPELTAERFVPDPFSGKRMYRTGDRGRWRNDGKLVHLGRTDHQVKVRGYRIELGEIEAVLSSHAAVAQAVVDARPGPGGEKRLVAYVVPRGPLPPQNELREFVRASLPDYMVPVSFTPLEQVPLTPNGKVDRRALPEPSVAAVATSYVPPRSATEKIVAEVWRELLGIDAVAVDDNFLDLGGHSLLIMRAIAMLEGRTGKRISPRSFVFQSLEQIAAEYAQASTEPPPQAPPPRNSGVISRLFSALTRRA